MNKGLNKGLLVAVVLVMVISLLVGLGCPAPVEVEPPVVEPGVPRRGGTVVLLAHHALPGLSPDEFGWATLAAVFNIHNAMFEPDENFVLRPVLAESYELSPDGLTYTFRLRRGVKFHDGAPFTSADVKYTFDFYRDPANAALIGAHFAGIDRIETPDDYTVVIHLEEPNAAFLRLAATSYIVPKHYHGKVGEEMFRTAPIGTGPFKLVEWRPAEFTLLEAFDDHFRGRPYIDYLRFDVVPEAPVRAIALEVGKADSSIWNLMPQDNRRLVDDLHFPYFRTKAVALNKFMLNTQIPQLSDRRVRQAMMYAHCRYRIVEEVYGGMATVAHSIVSPALEFWVNPDVRRYEYNPEKAKALLDEAGWKVGPDGIRVKDGLRLSFTMHPFSGDVVRGHQTLLLQDYLRRVGIEMLIKETPAMVVLPAIRGGEIDGAIFNFGVFPSHMDATGVLGTGAGNNFSQWSNARVDELLAKALREMDTEKRREIIFEIQAIVAEEVPFLPQTFWHWYNIWSGRIRGLPETALIGQNVYRFMYRVWIEE